MFTNTWGGVYHPDETGHIQGGEAVDGISCSKHRSIQTFVSPSMDGDELGEREGKHNFLFSFEVIMRHI